MREINRPPIPRKNPLFKPKIAQFLKDQGRPDLADWEINKRE